MKPRTPLQRRILQSLVGLPLNDRGAEYLDKRGLLEIAEPLGFGVVPDSAAPNLRRYRGRLVIPSIGPRDNVYDVAFRCIEDHVCKDTVVYTDQQGRPRTCRKYLFLDGLDKRLYNLRALARAGEVIDICEGQLDAATLEACGLHAVGVPGVNNWKDHHRRLFQGFSRVRVWGDSDTAGRDFANRVSGSVAAVEVMMVPWGKDVNSTYVEMGRDKILAIAEGEAEDAEDDGGWGLEPELDIPPF